MLPLDKVRCSFYFMSFQNEQSCKLTTEIKIKVAIKASGNAVVRISPRNAILNSCHWKWKHHSTRLSTVRFNQKKRGKERKRDKATNVAVKEKWRDQHFYIVFLCFVVPAVHFLFFSFAHRTIHVKHYTRWLLFHWISSAQYIYREKVAVARDSKGHDKCTSKCQQFIYTRLSQEYIVNTFVALNWRFYKSALAIRKIKIFYILI